MAEFFVSLSVYCNVTVCIDSNTAVRTELTTALEGSYQTGIG